MATLYTPLSIYCQYFPPRPWIRCTNKQEASYKSLLISYILIDKSSNYSSDISFVIAIIKRERESESIYEARQMRKPRKYY